MIFIVMAQPNPQGDKRISDFNEIFLNYVKDKPFYVMDRMRDMPVPNRATKNLVGDSISGLYYVGELLDGNFVFDNHSRVNVYFDIIDKGYQIRRDAHYWVETVLNNFERGVWVLAEWYHNGVKYKDVIDNLTDVEKFNPFQDLNESEEEFSWVKDLGGEMFGDEVKYTFLRTGDEIIFSTDMSFRGCGFPEELEGGKILKTNGRKFLVRTNNLTFCGPNLENWSDGSRTMLEGLVEKCNGSMKPNESRYHNCIEIERNTRARYYMVKGREELNESHGLSQVIKSGTPIYCHQNIANYMAGNWYTIQSVCYECGPHGEDTFKIYDHIRDMDTNGSWTIQKDENGLNYEDWFSLTDNLSGFDTHDAFENLYEDNGHNISLEDGTTIVFPYDFKEEDVYKILNWLKSNEWEFGYSEQDLKSVLYDLDKKWNKGKRRIFFMLRKNDKPWKQEKVEKMVYWAPVGKLESAPATFTKVINAEDLLSSIDTDFFITESTDDFSWAEEAILPLNNCKQTVIVTDKGQVYDAYLNAMAELDVPFALEIVNGIRKKYNTIDVSNNMDRNWSNGMREDHSRGMWELSSKGVLGSPRNGDICCLYNKKYKYISRLVRLSDGKNFIMNDRGFKLYDGSENLNEQEQWFDEVEDLSKYIKVGQRFTFRSRLSEYSKEVITGQIVEVNPKYIRIVPVNMVTNKINPFTKGTKFTPKRLMELLTSGDWTPVKS